MTKNEFLDCLASHLNGLSQADIDRSLEFYGEMIEDRIEEGEEEQAAVAAIGSPEDAARRIMMEMPLPKIVKAKTIGKRRLATWEIVLIVVGAPLWFPLLCGAAVVLLALYAVLWSVAVTFWAVDLTLCALSVTGLALFGVLLGAANVPLALLFLAAGLCLGGITLFAFLGCRAFSILTAKLAALIWRGIKSVFVGKGDKA